jgi:hypothetical protein
LKKFTRYSLIAFFAVIFAQWSVAQNGKQIQMIFGNNPRCATMEGMEAFWKTNPGAKVQFEQEQAEFQRKFEERLAELVRNNTNGRNVNAITTIPVVVHILLPDPNVVSNAAVIDQINILNVDFAGLNADSTNQGAFNSVFGKSQIRFCLAQRTPSNTPSNGINRVVTSQTSAGSVVGDRIKYSAQNGQDSWDPTRFMNIWVCSFANASLLGYATFPGTGTFPLNEHGLVVNYRAFSSVQPVSGPGLIPAFNKGRTAVHEIGHFFNLRHIWGDAGGCSPDDGVADTPAQDQATGGCPVGVLTDACQPAAPGIQYQNYMDYTDDACYSMFTRQQATRMETSLTDPSRVGLTTSNGCTPVVLPSLDARVAAILTPTNGSTQCNATVAPQVRIENLGSTAINNVQVVVRLDGVDVQTTNYTTPLASLGTATLNLAAIPVATGTRQMKIFTRNPNGTNPDNVPSNDTITVTFNVGVGIAPPVVEGFEGSPPFPPAGWTLVNPNAGSITWELYNSAAAARSGTKSARIRLYDYSTTGHRDMLQSPITNVAGYDSVFVTFWYAHRVFSTSATFADSMEVVVSTDCGTNFTRVWNFGGVGLATVTGTQGSAFIPTTAQYRRVRLNLSAVVGNNNNIIVGFRTFNRFGNNIHIDDINIERIILPDRDARVSAIIDPSDKSCQTPFKPTVVITNDGKVALTSTTIRYRVDNGTLQSFNYTGNIPARGGTATVVLDPAVSTTAGNRVFTAYTDGVNGLSDQNTANDTLRKNFKAYDVVDVASGVFPESFEAPTYPPSGWEVINPNGDLTFVRNPNYAKTGTASTYLNGWNATIFNRFDELYSPFVRYAGGIDSVFMTFQVSSATYSFPGSTGVPIDTLEVFLTRDCGKTYQLIYKKLGEELQTINNPNGAYPYEFFPYAHQWRRDSINLGQWLSKNGESQFQVFFRYRQNFENNFFLDDVNIFTRTLPAKLKNQGYMISPTAFSNQFNIQHYLQPTKLQSIQVYNSIGQLIWGKDYNGDASAWITIDMSNRPAGVYTVKLNYEGKNVVERVVKTN